MMETSKERKMIYESIEIIVGRFLFCPQTRYKVQHAPRSRMSHQGRDLGTFYDNVELIQCDDFGGLLNSVPPDHS